ncbi:MAG: hypothetical protein K2X08_01230 [Chlamydiales bacterium]|nr:hypothetical protein [Chlamydiales bacterium]MBY0530201.1 hypothetical protein [Rhabdochlamydiaceae bacterium]
MATKKEIDEHLKKALKEIGEITPIFDEEVGEWIFSSSLYPVEYGGSSEKEVIKNYPKYLREFIKHRLDDNLHPLMKKKTKGHGGKRKGAGRPKGTKKQTATKIVRLPADVADWVQSNPERSIPTIRQLIAKSRH